MADRPNFSSPRPLSLSATSLPLPLIRKRKTIPEEGPGSIVTGADENVPLPHTENDSRGPDREYGHFC
jgi:hypothetical protein